MRELSLFSGAGGGLLASLLLGHTLIGAVEIDEYCCRVLDRRQRDGALPKFPIFQTDIRRFIQEGYAELYKGHCDLVSAGFPCQPFSVAGRREGSADQRNMWPATMECLRLIRPRFAFLENVPGLLTSGYFGCIVGDLAESGYDLRWRILSAAELGAPHKRDRLWMVAHTDRHEQGGRQQPQREQDWGDAILTGHGAQGAVADAEGQRQRPGLRAREQGGEWGRRPGNGGGEGNPWLVESEVDRVADGVAHRVDRLKSLGNGQVPIVAARAWQILAGGLYGK